MSGASRPQDSRPRIDDRACFDAIVVRIVTGSSWLAAAMLCPAAGSATTLWRR